MTPVRIQRRRTKGWRMPPNTVSVTRSLHSFWGNPFHWRQGLEAGDQRDEAWAKGAAVDLFREWLKHPEHFPHERKPPTAAEIKRRLGGKNLACFCKPEDPCHADVLLEIANS